MIDGFETWLQDPDRLPLVMGILELTPDSFSDGGKFFDPEAAVRHAEQMAAAGASVIDVGGESTRPGSQPVAETEQIRRIVPVICSLAGRIGAVLSVDTSRAAVAQAVLTAATSSTTSSPDGTIRGCSRWWPTARRR